MFKRSVAIVLATVSSIGIAASISTAASAKPTQIQRVQSSPKVMNLRQVNPKIIKPKYTLNPKLVKPINTRFVKPLKPINPGLIKPLNPNLVGKLPPKFPPLHPPGNNNNNNNNNNNTNNNTNTNTNTNVNTNVNANFNSNSSVSVADATSVAGAAAVVGGAAVVGTTAVAGGPTYYRSAGRSCLTKEYLQTGQVLFRDLCTNEWAANPPAGSQ
jgi:hypothetical protein